MAIKRVAFREVELGDMIYQPDYYAEDKWREVTNISQTGDTVSLGMGVSVSAEMDTRTYQVGHAEEGISVKRDEL